MTRLTRGLLVTISICMLGIAASVAPTDSPIAGADRWAAALSDSESARWLEPAETLKLPFEYRKALIARQGPATKLQFWKDALLSVENSVDELNVVQMESMAETRRLVDRLFGDVPVSPEVRLQIAEVRSRFTAAFGPDAARVAFVTGPGASSGADLPFGERVLWTWRTAKPGVLAAFSNVAAPTVSAIGCNCNEAADDCYYEQHCRSPFACEPSSWGCGSFWMEECNKRCSYDVN